MRLPEGDAGGRVFGLDSSPMPAGGTTEFEAATVRRVYEPVIRAVARSVSKTGRVLVVHEANKTNTECPNAECPNTECPNAE